MDTDNQNIMVIPKKIVTNKDILEEIKKLFQEELNTDPECISLYDLSQLLKQTWKQEKNIIQRYKEEFDYIIRNSENTTGRVFSIIFDYSKKQLKIEYYRSNSLEKVIYSKKDDDLYIVSSSDKYYAQKILVILGNPISQLFDKLLEHKEFEQIGWYNPKSVNSNFLISINSVYITISSISEPKRKETNFSLLTWHNESKYQYNCNSNKIISEINSQENELFKRIFIKIEDCPEWTREVLTKQRLEELTKEQRQKELIQIQEEKKQKRLALIRKIFPFLNSNRMTMDETQIEIVNRHLYLEDKLSKLSIMQSDNKLTERTLNILFTKLRYEDDENLSLTDLEYLVNAYLMPYDEINKYLERYDLSNPKIDEIKFIDELANIYNVDKNKIIDRINQVRNINKLIKLEQNKKVKRLTN